MRTSPPILVSFEDVGTLIKALPRSVSERDASAITSLFKIGLPPATSLVTLSVIFGLSTSFIRAIYISPKKYYRKFTIRKGRKTRDIAAPRVGLKIIQKWLGYHLSNFYSPSQNVYGFVPGKSGVIEAARLHCNAHWVYSLDLQDFFPSISSAQINDALIDIGYDSKSAELISRLCTLDESLPQGSPASPVLSNIVFSKTDNKLIQVAQDLKINYSRYADDLVFSGIENPDPDFQDRIKSILLADGWVIATRKEHFAQLPNRLKVHGLLVHGDAPRLTKGYRNRIRAYKHLLGAGKIKSTDLDRVKGHLAYASFVEKASST